MKNPLLAAIRENTEVMFANAEIMLRTCDPEYLLCGMPVWRHLYHTFHSCDRWYINPCVYEEPAFHAENLNSLDLPCEKVLSMEELAAYLAAVREKILAYLDGLTDERLTEIPEGCSQNRLGLILSQIRHFYAHIGYVNATTIIERNEWPRVVGVGDRLALSDEELYE
ncbi:MAG: DinB family protein [Ruminococcaceae bacterium]|nr:DinB family protein [Oscillospiraceae bacterium]